MKRRAFKRILEFTEDPERWQGFKRSMLKRARREHPDMTSEQLENHWQVICEQFGFDVGDPVDLGEHAVVAPTAIGDNFLPVDFHENIDEQGNYVGEPFAAETNPKSLRKH